MDSEYDFNEARRGPVVPVPKGKVRITIRLDEDVVAWFKQQVQIGLDQIERREYLTHEEVGKRVEKLSQP